MQEIAGVLGCSLHKVAYWMGKYNIKIRSRSEATYIKRNPEGDPFKFKNPQDVNGATLFGLGIGLYWGEGTKADLNSVKLGNADPILIQNFMTFLIKNFSIDKTDLKFGLQLFTDIDVDEALDFWTKKLNIKRSQINKPIITKSGSIGTYRKKSQYGVMTVMYHNKKLRDLLVSFLPNNKPM
ncbi:MAG TPA: hypothetical protein VHZ04_00770 [Candidatus Paceibacterota bacterium]|jgi:hypothetical protein|nr:hypothetical protein [Candidatus Paceibacterota bacterium]